MKHRQQNRDRDHSPFRASDVSDPIQSRPASIVAVTERVAAPIHNQFARLGIGTATALSPGTPPTADGILDCGALSTSTANRAAVDCERRSLIGIRGVVAHLFDDAPGHNGNPGASSGASNLVAIEFQNRASANGDASFPAA